MIGLLLWGWISVGMEASRWEGYGSGLRAHLGKALPSPHPVKLYAELWISRWTPGPWYMDALTGWWWLRGDRWEAGGGFRMSLTPWTANLPVLDHRTHALGGYGEYDLVRSRRYAVALRLAGVWNLPGVMVLENRRWALDPGDGVEVALRISRTAPSLRTEVRIVGGYTFHGYLLYGGRRSTYHSGYGYGVIAPSATWSGRSFWIKLGVARAIGECAPGVTPLGIRVCDLWGYIQVGWERAPHPSITL